MTRGIRNNNPLNIRHSADQWQGARVEQTDKAFVQFKSMAYGYRAAWKVLESYWNHFYQNIAELNNIVKKDGGSYLLIGPGRWGSSDPWLGIPVMWTDISEARMIVETAIPGYQIEPSQGTHFFQNITSLGVGYLTIDTVRGDGFVKEDEISALECICEKRYTKLYKAPDCMDAYIDRTSNEAVVGC